MLHVQAASQQHRDGGGEVWGCATRPPVHGVLEFVYMHEPRVKSFHSFQLSSP